MNKSMQSKKFEKRNYYEDQSIANQDFDINQEFGKTAKDFAKYTNYEDRVNYLKKKNQKIFEDIKNNEKGIDISQIEKKVRNEGINIGHK